MISGKITVLGLVVAGIIAFSSLAISGEGKGKGKGAKCESRKAFKEAIKTHMEKQREENKAFMETLKGKTAAEMCAAIKENRATQNTENKAFFAEQHSKMVEELKKTLTEKGVEEEKIAEAVKQAEENFAKRTAHHDAQFTENMEFLDSLANDKDLTPEGLKEKLKTHMKTQRKENKKLRKTMHEGRKERRAERKENREKEE